jgi:hypothetical protein
VIEAAHGDDSFGAKKPVSVGNNADSHRCSLSLTDPK